jgi:DNA primase
MEFQSLIETKLEPVGKSGDDIIYICPQCDDKSGHLYINYNKGYWHCFKCGAGGKRIESLLRLLHIEIGYDYTKLYNEQNKELDDIISIRNSIRKTIKTAIEYSNDLQILTEYYNLHTKDISESAYYYLRNKRGLTDDCILSLGIREGVNRYGETFNLKGKEYQGRDYSGRIMVPSLRRDGTISFYVGRDYIGDKPAKYMNPPKELGAASEDVWSLDIVNTPSIIICEGVFTAIAVNQALGKIVTCATYGKSIAQRSSNDSGILVTSQGEKLLNRNFKQYIIFYDKDAMSEAINTAKYLYDRGANVKIVKIDTDKYGPKADAADMTNEEIQDHIKKAIDYNGEISGLTL